MQEEVNKKLNENLDFLMKKIGLNCKICDANCCKILTSDSKNLNIILDEEDEAHLLRKQIELEEKLRKDMTLINYLSFDVKNYVNKNGDYIVKKINFDFSNDSNIIGLRNDYPLRTENGILRIPIMNFKELDEKGYLRVSACSALNTENKECTIHDINPLFCKLFPYYLEPYSREGMYGSKYFLGYFLIKVTPCDEKGIIYDRVKRLKDEERNELRIKIHEILENRENFIARLTAFYELNSQLISNFDFSERIDL
ncbi:MAG: YkgJ family cysteine cluster protein [Candidatus Woesearchaeota archaeon]